MSRSEAPAWQSWIAGLVLRWTSPLARLRRIPVLGTCVSWAGERLLPRARLAWVQVQAGPAKGLWLQLHPRTAAEYFQGSGEPEVQTVLRQHLRAGMTCYDIGANLGFFSLLAGRLVGNEGKVVAFEADPEVASRLRDHVRRNAMNWITVEEKAVWSETGTVHFARADPQSSPGRGLGYVATASEAGTIAVGAVSLDDYAFRHPAPDFLKCDVEGAEVAVFRGAQRLLYEKRPGIICEMHGDENRRALEAEFARLGYSCTRCGMNHVLAIPH